MPTILRLPVGTVHASHPSRNPSPLLRVDEVVQKHRSQGLRQQAGGLHIERNQLIKAVQRDLAHLRGDQPSRGVLEGLGHGLSNAAVTKSRGRTAVDCYSAGHHTQR